MSKLFVLVVLFTIMHNVYGNDDENKNAMDDLKADEFFFWPGYYGRGFQDRSNYFYYSPYRRSYRRKKPFHPPVVFGAG